MELRWDWEALGVTGMELGGTEINWEGLGWDWE